MNFSAPSIIPKGTKIVDSEGNEVKSIIVNLKDKNYNGFSNGVVFGETLYQGLPDGVTFEPPITLTINYNKEDIVNEERLAIGQLSKGIWVGVPSIVDTEKNIVSAKISHFTDNAILDPSCNTFRITNENSFNYGKVYEQTCGNSYLDEGSCIEAVWTDENGGWHEEETSLDFPKIVSVNLPLGTMNLYSECVVKDWDEDDQKVDEICFEEKNNCEIYDSEGNLITSQMDSTQEAPLHLIYSNFLSYDEFTAIDNVEQIFFENDGIKDDSCECQWFPADFENNLEEHTECQCELATFNTYGYDEESAVTDNGKSGDIQLPFYFLGQGESCIMKDANDDFEIKVELKESEGDVCYLLPNSIIGDGETYKEVEYRLSYGENFVVGTNYLFPYSIKSKNTPNDGCLWAEARVIFKGKDIYNEPFKYGCNIPEFTEEQCINKISEIYREKKGLEITEISCENMGDRFYCNYI